jgi:hypothetical protein
MFLKELSLENDGLLAVWMDRALFGDEPLIDFITVYCLLVVTLNFTFFRSIAQRLPLWQISHRVSELIGKPQTNSSEGIGNFCK